MYKTIRIKLRTAKEYIFAHKKISIGVAIVLVVAVFFLVKSSSSSASTYTLMAARTDTIASTVSGSGQVAASSELAIKSKVSGDVVRITSVSGDSVKKGAVLFTLDSTDADKSVRDKMLALKNAQLDLQTAQTTADNTETANNLALTSSLETLNSSVYALPDHNNTDNVTIAISGSYLSTEKGRYTVTAYGCTNGVCISYEGLETGNEPVATGVVKALGTRGLYFSFNVIPKIGDKWYIDVPSPAASGYLSNASAYSQKQQSVKSDADTTAANLAYKKIAVEQAQNALSDAEDIRDEYTIRAPFSGIFSGSSVIVGQTVSSSDTLGTILTTDKVATISLNEVDVAKVAVGDTATLTFDALPTLSVNGVVSEVDTLGTVSSGVVTYTVKITFASDAPEVKPGMSVNASIVYASKDSALVVPISAVKTKRGGSYVSTLTKTTFDTTKHFAQTVTAEVPTDVLVTTGIKSDKMIEITSGLQEGQFVITKTVAGTATTTASAQTPTLFSALGGGGGSGGRGATGGAGGATRALTR